MKLKAYAKINLTLDVCGRRPDGYHLLDSVMQSISLDDTVILNPAEEISVDCPGLQLSGEDNIAAIAARHFFAFTGVISGAHITIKKRIPMAAGLGGGSADAAAVLYGLDRMYETGLSAKKLCELALLVGADVPFCLNGGTARVGGIGESIVRLSPLSDCFFVLIKCGEKPSTAEMYRRLDAVSVSHPDTDGAVMAIKTGNIKELGSCIGNSFSAVCDTENICKILAQTNPIGISLSGSGPVVYAMYETAQQAKAAQQDLINDKIDFLTAVPCNQGVSIENYR